MGTLLVRYEWVWFFLCTNRLKPSKTCFFFSNIDHETVQWSESNGMYRCVQNHIFKIPVKKYGVSHRTLVTGAVRNVRQSSSTQNLSSGIAQICIITSYGTYGETFPCCLLTLPTLVDHQLHFVCNQRSVPKKTTWTLMEAFHCP